MSVARQWELGGLPGLGRGPRRLAPRLEQLVPARARTLIPAGDYFNVAQVMKYRGSRPYMVLGKLVKGLNCAPLSPARPPPA